MKRHGIPHHMCTVTLGIHKDYKNNAYYANNFDESAERINRIFKEASAKGVHVEKRSVSLEEIIDHLKSKLIVICLLDAMLLECCWCDTFRRSCLCCFKICPKLYQGHFVVVCGYDCDKKLIFYKNPGIHQELCCSRWDQFDNARKSFGTDEDILFIDEKSLHYTKPLTDEDIDNLNIS
ncbi:protein GUCD1-like [Gigantopelta aegis]|uniref:protein GUCD1-like n=1 Tax=Gigantopelta aegis TaxID=1735272 RepID=UPI001B88D19E|nr:protein GUCD1-like [Gigantopelta aegis]